MCGWHMLNPAELKIVGDDSCSTLEEEEVIFRLISLRFGFCSHFLLFTSRQGKEQKVAPGAMIDVLKCKTCT